METSVMEGKSYLDDQLDRLESLDNRLPNLEAERTQLEDQITAKRDEDYQRETSI